MGELSIKPDLPLTAQNFDATPEFLRYFVTQSVVGMDRTFGIAKDNIVLHMFDMAMEYNIDTFTEDRCYLK